MILDAFASKKEAGPHLKTPGIVGLAANGTKGWVAKRRIRISEPWSIGEVKELTAQLQLYAFPEWKDFKDRKVEVMITKSKTSPVSTAADEGMLKTPSRTA